MNDRLSALFTHFGVTVRTFHAGAMCGINTIGDRDGLGQLHLVRSGWVNVFVGASPPIRIEEPSLLLFPRPLPRRFQTDPAEGAELVCADLCFEGGATNPIQAALPDVVCMPLASLAESASVLALLFSEAELDKCGRQKMLDSLFEVLLVQVLRELMERRAMSSGMLAGLSHPKLRRALVAMHDQPEHSWPLESLADAAGMSRTSFANSFRDVVGTTPGQYLLAWRMGLAQKLLLLGTSMRQIADRVGYADEAVLSRAFKSHTGVSPREWKSRAESSPQDGTI